MQAKQMSNEQLAHELLLDPAFRLDDEGGNCTESSTSTIIRQAFQTAFWDCLIADLSLTPPCYTRVVRVLGEIHDGIADLSNNLARKFPLTVSNIINIPAIQQAVDSNSLEWADCTAMLKQLSEMLRRMQAPKRDKGHVQKWVSHYTSLRTADTDVGARPRVFCNALQFILNYVNLIRIDAANTRLKLIAPVIYVHGVEYERAHFQRKIEAGTVDLTSTFSAIKNVIEAEVNAGNVSVNDLVAGKAPAFAAIHRAMVLAIITGEDRVTYDNVPHTLRLDLSRLQRAQAAYRASCVLTPLPLIFSQVSELNPSREENTKVRSALDAFIEQYQPDTQFDPETMQDQLMQFVGTRTGLQPDHSTMASLSRAWELVTASQAGATGTAAVVTRLFAGPSGRVAKVIAEAIATGCSVSKPGSPLCAVPESAPIRKLSSVLQKFTRINLQVHTACYNTAIGAAVKQLYSVAVKLEG